MLGWLQPLELRLLDWRAALTRHAVNSDLVLVEIDADSLQRLHHWPWPRRYHAQLLDALRRVGVKDVFYDVDFSASSTPADDRRLAGALAAFSRDSVMLPAFVQPRSSLEMDGLLSVTPLPALRRNTLLASVNLHPDQDGLVRRIIASGKVGAGTVEPAGIHMAGGLDYRPTAVQIDYSIDPGSFRRVSFADILAGRFDHSLLRDKHIIVGATAIELGDNLPVPVYHSLPGAVVQALAYQTLREGGLRPTPLTLDLVLAITLAGLMGWVLPRASWRAALLFIAGLCSLVLVGAVYAYRDWHTVMAVAPPITQALLGYGLFLVARVEHQHLRLLIQSLALRRKDALMSSVVNNSLDAIFTVSASGVIESVNPAGMELFHSDAPALVGRHLGELISDLSDIDAAAKEMGVALVDGGIILQRLARRMDGSVFPVELALSRMHLDGHVVYTLFVRDITERIKQREALEFQATHDALTSLANRHQLYLSLHQTLPAAVANQETIALLLIDLNKFKEINDALGHGAGDLVLERVAERLQACATDAMVLARIGGDEFALTVAEGGEKRCGLQLAEALLAALAPPFVVGDMALEIGASIGIAYCPEHGHDAATLLQNADTAMYAAKRAGVGCALYQAEFSSKNRLRMTISTGLRQAMAESQLKMYYQPKLDLRKNQVTSVEALLRWHHPELGFIAPDEIIDVAENTGVIWPLTEWTLRQALLDSGTWRGMGYQIRVAVNLSARLLQDMALIERVTTCLSECATDQRQLTLEITESALMSDPDRALKNATMLSALGIQISIDDFGTGYSSLSYLKRLPAGELKIDKSFVMDMLEKNNDFLIVKSTIDLAHTLGLMVVAEGVETKAILESLRAQGCDIAQGYFISRPKPFGALTEWLVENCCATQIVRASGY